jgi:hypothetical protein
MCCDVFVRRTSGVHAIFRYYILAARCPPLPENLSDELDDELAIELDHDELLLLLLDERNQHYCQKASRTMTVTVTVTVDLISATSPTH